MPSHEDVFPQSHVNNNEQFLFEGYRNVKSRLIYRNMSTQKSFCRDGIQKLPLSSRSTFQHAFTQTISTKTKTTQCARNREVQTEVDLDAIGSYEDRVLSPKAYLTFDMMAGSRQAAATKIQARWRGKHLRNQNLNASGKELFIQEEDSQSKYQLKTTSSPKFFSSPYVKFWLKTKQGVYIYTEHPNAESMKKWLEILANLSHEELEGTIFTPLQLIVRTCIFHPNPPVYYRHWPVTQSPFSFTLLVILHFLHFDFVH